MSTDDELRVKFVQLGSEYTRLQGKLASLKKEKVDERRKTQEQEEKLRHKDGELRRNLSEIDNLTFTSTRLRTRCEKLVDHVKQQQTNANSTQSGWVGSFLGGGLSTKEEQLLREVSVVKEELSKQILENNRVHLAFSDAQQDKKKVVHDLTNKMDTLKTVLEAYETDYSALRQELHSISSSLTLEKEEQQSKVLILQTKIDACTRTFETKLSSFQPYLLSSVERLTVLKEALKSVINTDKFGKYQSFQRPAFSEKRVSTKFGLLAHMDTFLGSLSKAFQGIMSFCEEKVKVTSTQVHTEEVNIAKTVTIVSQVASMGILDSCPVMGSMARSDTLASKLIEILQMNCSNLELEIEQMQGVVRMLHSGRGEDVSVPQPMTFQRLQELAYPCSMHELRDIIVSEEYSQQNDTAEHTVQLSSQKLALLVCVFRVVEAVYKLLSTKEVLLLSSSLIFASGKQNSISLASGHLVEAIRKIRSFLSQTALELANIYHTALHDAEHHNSIGMRAWTPHSAGMWSMDVFLAFLCSKNSQVCFEDAVHLLNSFIGKWKLFSVAERTLQFAPITVKMVNEKIQEEYTQLLSTVHEFAQHCSTFEGLKEQLTSQIQFDRPLTLLEYTHNHYIDNVHDLLKDNDTEENKLDTNALECMLQTPMQVQDSWRTLFNYQASYLEKLHAVDVEATTDVSNPQYKKMGYTPAIDDLARINTENETLHEENAKLRELVQLLHVQVQESTKYSDSREKELTAELQSVRSKLEDTTLQLEGVKKSSNILHAEVDALRILSVTPTPSFHPADLFLQCKSEVEKAQLLCDVYKVNYTPTQPTVSSEISPVDTLEAAKLSVQYEKMSTIVKTQLNQSTLFREKQKEDLAQLDSSSAKQQEDIDALESVLKTEESVLKTEEVQKYIGLLKIGYKSRVMTTTSVKQYSQKLYQCLLTAKEELDKLCTPSERNYSHVFHADIQGTKSTYSLTFKKPTDTKLFYKSMLHTMKVEDKLEEKKTQEQLTHKQEQLYIIENMLGTVVHTYTSKINEVADNIVHATQVEKTDKTQISALQSTVRNFENVVEELTLKIVDQNEQIVERENQNIQVQQMLLNSGITPEMYAGQ